MLKLVNVSKYYSSEGNVALGLRNINIKFEKNEFVAIVGESGSGKTTLLNVISGIDSYEEGEMYFSNQETSYYSMSDWEDYRKNNIGFVFQNYNLIESYSVLQNVETVLLLRGVSKKDARKRALEIIERVGLSNRKRSRAAKLSGGEKQRVVIARAIASDSKILVCDEPTGNLDSENSEQIMSLINEVAPGRLVVVVTHDYSLVEPYATRKVRLFDGEIVEDVNLKPKKPDAEDKTELVNNQPRFLTNLLFGLRNLVMTPKRTIFSLLVYIAITFTIVGIYDSTFLAQPTNYRYSYTYTFTDNRRLILNKPDYSPFSEQEIEDISKISGVNYVHKNDFYLDSAIYFYDDDNWEFYTLILQSINQLKEADIIQGRMPENDLEVVVTNDKLLGKKINQSFYDKKYEFEIVGITDKNYQSNYYGSGTIYASDLLRKQKIIEQGQSYFGFSLKGIDELEEYSYLERISFAFEPSYEDGVIRLSLGAQISELEFNDEDIKVYLTSIYGEKEITDVTIEIIREPDNYTNFIFMNENTFFNLIDNEVYQISVILDDSFIKGSLMSQLRNKGYRVIDVSDFPSYGFDGLMMLIETIMKTFVAGLGIVFLYFVTYMILHLVMNSKKRDYSILRILGANRKNLNSIVSIENITLGIIAYITTFVGVIIINQYYSLGVMNIIKYRDYGSMLILLIIIVILAFMLSVRFSRKMFESVVNVVIRRS